MEFDQYRIHTCRKERTSTVGLNNLGYGTRNADYQSLNTRGLFPGGEGAGYAGGILSAGVDGIKVAEAVAQSLLEQP